MALQVRFAKERHPGRWILTIFIIIVIGVIGWFGYRWYTTGELPFEIPFVSANNNVQVTEPSADDISAYTVPAANPRYLRIPSLDIINSRVYPIGVTDKDQLDTPKNIYDVGWYEKSSTPGMGGVTLLNGQSVGKGQDGVFAQLATLPIDGIIEIVRGDGQVFSYKVLENQSVPVADVDTAAMSTMGKSAIAGIEALNIITNDGTWIPKLQSFDHRILLRAVITD